MTLVEKEFMRFIFYKNVILIKTKKSISEKLSVDAATHAVMLSPRRDFIAVCSKPHQTADVSAVCIQGIRHLATIVGPEAWCLERRSLG